MFWLRIISIALLCSVAFSRSYSSRGAQEISKGEIAKINRIVNENIRRELQEHTTSETETRYVEPTPALPESARNPSTTVSAVESVTDEVTEAGGIQCRITEGHIWNLCRPVLQRTCVQHFRSRCRPRPDALRRFYIRARLGLSRFRPSKDQMFQEGTVRDWLNRHMDNPGVHYSFSITINNETRQFSSDDDETHPHFGQDMFNTMLGNQLRRTDSRSWRRHHDIPRWLSDSRFSMQRPRTRNQFRRRHRMRNGVYRPSGATNDPSSPIPKSLPKYRGQRFNAKTKRHLQNPFPRHFRNQDQDRRRNMFMQRMTSNIRGRHGQFHRFGLPERNNIMPWAGTAGGEVFGPYNRHHPAPAWHRNDAWRYGRYHRQNPYHENAEEDDDDDEEDDNDDEEEEEYDGENEGEEDDEEEDDEEEDDEDDDDYGEDDEDDDDDDDDEDDEEEEEDEDEEDEEEEDISCDDFEDNPAEACMEIGQRTKKCDIELERVCPEFAILRRRIGDRIGGLISSQQSRQVMFGPGRERIHHSRTERHWGGRRGSEDPVTIEHITVEEDGKGDVEVIVTLFGREGIPLSIPRSELNAADGSMADMITRKVQELFREQP